MGLKATPTDLEAVDETEVSVGGQRRSDGDSWLGGLSKAWDTVVHTIAADDAPTRHISHSVHFTEAEQREIDAQIKANAEAKRRAEMNRGDAQARRKRVARLVRLLLCAARLVGSAVRARRKLQESQKYRRKEGFLKKKGGTKAGGMLHRRNWKWRYFVLDEGWLVYFESDKKVGPGLQLGSFNMKTTVLKRETHVGKDGKERKTSFFLETADGRSSAVAIEATTSKAYDEWVAALTWSIAYYRKRPTPNAPLVRMASAQESSLARISSEADPNPHFSKKSPAAPKVFGQC